MLEQQSDLSKELSDLLNVNKRLSATELVIEAMKQLLMSKKIKPGDKLPSEKEIAQIIGVSRGSVREAMKILSAIGIVDIRQGDGTYVSDASNQGLLDPLLFRLMINYDGIKELREFREMIEFSIMRAAISNAEEKDIEDLKEAYNYAVKKVEAGEYKDEVIIECEKRFHDALGKATRNKLMRIIYNFIFELYIPNIVKRQEDGKAGERALVSHKLMLDAITQRDIGKGEQAVKYAVKIWIDDIDTVEG